MKATMLVLLTMFTVFGMGGMDRIDSIVTKSRDLRNKGVKGFIVQQKQSQQLMAPEELFGEMDRVEDAEEAEPPEEAPMERSHRLAETPRQRPRSTQTSYVPWDHYVTDMNVKNEEVAELKLKVDRLTTAVGYITDNASDQKKMIQLLTKFLELLTPLLIAIGGVFGWNKVKARKKNGGAGTQIVNTPT